MAEGDAKGSGSLIRCRITDDSPFDHRLEAIAAVHPDQVAEENCGELKLCISALSVFHGFPQIINC
jgi:hypothetical protein